MNLKITDLLDDYMDDFPVDIMPVPDNNRIKEATMKRMHKSRFSRPVRMMLIAAAIIVLLAGTTFAVWQYSRITDTMEENWNAKAETDMTEEQKDFVESRAAGIGESVTDQGITVTIDSVVCTTNTVEYLYSVELDPTVYDVDSVFDVLCRSFDVWLENEDYGTWNYGSARGGGVSSEDGVYWSNMQYTFENLPEDARINDGKTMMHLGIGICEFFASGEDDVEVEGSWTFEFPLPEADAAPARTSDIAWEFTGDVYIGVSNIAIEEYGCTFEVETDNNEYIFANNGMEAELAHAAEPDAPIYTVAAKLADGTQIPSDGASMSWNEETDTDLWSIQWSAPVDPETVVSLVFSDGTTEIEVPLN